MSLNNRKGVFSMPCHIDEKDFPRWYDQTQCVLERCVVVRAESMCLSNTIDYHAISPYFDEVKIGDSIPEYIAIIRNGDSGHPEFIRFERK